MNPKDFERFTLNTIAIALLQVLVLEMPQQVWRHFSVWFCTLPKYGYPSEQDCAYLYPRPTGYYFSKKASPVYFQINY
jgi:hypothetical protein